jgi:hypothetical protein
VTLDKPLLSPEQRALLNPMVLTIKSCEQLPHRPISYADLDQSCESTTVVFDLPGCRKTKVGSIIIMETKRRSFFQQSPRCCLVHLKRRFCVHMHVHNPFLLIPHGSFY